MELEKIINEHSKEIRFINHLITKVEIEQLFIVKAERDCILQLLNKEKSYLKDNMSRYQSQHYANTSKIIDTTKY